MASSSRRPFGGAVMTGDEGALHDLRDTLAQITRRLDELSAGVARLVPPASAAPAGEPLDEAARRALADLGSLLAVGPGLARETALLVAVDRVVHRAVADCAAVFLPTADGDLDAAAQQGFPAGPLRIGPAPGIVRRAFVERQTIRAGPAHRGEDPLLRDHGVEQGLAVPVRGGSGPCRGVLFAGRRRPAPFEPAALELVHFLADRLAFVVGGPDEPAPGLDLLGQDLDWGATAARVAREAARRLDAPRVAILLPDPGRPRIAALVGIPRDAVPPDADVEPLATVRATGRLWVSSVDPGPDDLVRFLGAPPRLVAPLVVGEQLVALLVAGGPHPLGPAALDPLVAPAACALRNARLYAETLAALAERRVRERAPDEPAPGPVRDFAGLLAVLLARVGLVRERVTDPALAADLAIAEEAAWRAAEAVRELLGFAPGARSGALEPLDLAAVIRAAAEATRHRWAGRGEGPAIELALDPLPPVRGSADDLREALEHLLANAGEATPTGAAVRVRAGWDGGDRVEVLVEDAGDGMDEAVRARVFEPFFSTKGPGRLGLGLPVAQAIVGRHRGALEIATAAGRGTTVRLTLPTAAGPRFPGPGSAPARVLVVEHERSVREALVALVEGQGHVAFGAADADEGLAIVHREAPEIVLTDLALPAMSGLEVARVVKRVRPGTPVILVTAWPGRLDAAALRESGVDRVVEKPVGGAQLFEAIAAALAPRRETRA